ncbi:MAG TPA: VOC family protein [Lysobacter sp.]|nr:VOC family protein [Lysobacter sp.]
MSHRSRLAGFIIDCQHGDLGASSAFWGAALGMSVADPDAGGTGRYAEFDDTPGGLHIEVQTVEHPSRVHLDIEADDVEAEVKRLEALGATRVAFVKTRWWVMEAPTGHRFCVVPMQDEPGRSAPHRWD